MTKFAKSIIFQSFGFGVIGAVAGYLLSYCLPQKMAGELTQTLGGLAAVAGSLLGWSAGWLDRSRSLIKEIDYDAARKLFREIGIAQRELIWRWGISLGFSLSVVLCSVMLKSDDLGERSAFILLIVCLAMLGIALGSIVYLFQTMIAASELKSDLEDYEHEELRKLRNTPPSERESAI